MEQLTDEVLLNIFSRLNAYDMIRAAFCCRALRAAVTSNGRSISHSSVISFLSKGYLHQSCFWAHDPSRHAWLSISADFLTSIGIRYGKLVAADGGLVCLKARAATNLSNGSAQKSALVICNPIIRSSRLVFFPDQTQRPLAICMKYKGASDGYDLFALIQRSAHSCSMLKYISSTSSWRLMASVTSRNGYYLACNTIISCNSVLYAVWRKFEDWRIFALDGGKWAEIGVPLITAAAFKQKVLLMDVAGILHIAVLVHNRWLEVRDLCIWKLQDNKKNWVEVSRMPIVLIELCRKRFKTDRLVNCLSKNGIAYIVFGSFNGQWDVIMYDVHKDEWQRIEQEKVYLGNSKVIFRHPMVIFEPSFEATP
ncbi:hypothetical protein KP509_12G092100 [Ceratopteris richardii]|uniref:F-box domain-containing protein n=1 Tax=Ceratopteris richardii TaxID=49495 RepID=A0A8T2TRV1_CERRI|nr:hypothetical protein KP509_12G092100 [Ceratopteris richardii]